MQYSNTKEFEKDLKKLLKRFRTLEEDLETAKRNAIELFHILGIDNQSVEPVPKYCFENIKICKIKKFSCKALKGKGCQSGIRVIYAFFPQEKKVEFIEIYYKGDKVNMDYQRATYYLNNF